MPLLQIPLSRAAFLILQWLEDSLAETDLDWLFSSGYLTAEPEAALALQSHMRSLRRRNLARPEWTLDAFLRTSSLPSAWTQRMQQAQSLLNAAKGRIRTPTEWVSLVPDLLRAIGLPSQRSFSSAEFQTWRRWEDALHLAGSGESAGLTADGVWFLGADEDAWPAPGSAHPLLPLSLQREFALPHA